MRDALERSIHASAVKGPLGLAEVPSLLGRHLQACGFPTLPTVLCGLWGAATVAVEGAAEANVLLWTRSWPTLCQVPARWGGCRHSRPTGRALVLLR